MRRPLVAGNWKLHGSHAENAQRVASILSGVRARGAAHDAAHGAADGGAQCVLCPPFVYLQEIGRALEGSALGLGAQNVSAEALGAFTGEVSAAMLKDVGCEYVIVGHSERRALYGEDDALVARKFAAAVASHLVPILCVGETLAEREAGSTEAVIGRQLEAVLARAYAGGHGAAEFATTVIAYEPVWAIGTGRHATPDQAQAVHAFIRGRIATRDVKIAAAVRIVYGGSVKPENAARLFAEPDVDGGLIGGASLKADEFLAILAAASPR
jgi:triosephosphate isomerase